jgi:serine/threonine protein kinase/tetratricopeptide (TPR) repeat protein
MTERTIFLAALDRPAAEWAAYLEAACAGEAGLRRRVEALLNAHAEAGHFLEPPAGVATAAFVPRPRAVDTPAAPESAGACVGPYKLLLKIGDGGMGSVWMAEQEYPVKRRVALKVIKAGMDSAQVVARFEAERQALALMDHPNIAKVLDAGTTASGRPYFVMELVRGTAITEFCDQHRLDPRSRLTLFVEVCQAVQHAHQKGVIHRDLKPSNVLVTMYDDKPVPKVIDFGVAKATGQPLTTRTLDTGLGGIVGTPEYMSPEQASLDALDVDTRSDVYSLGVLLYELLAGSPPFQRKELERAGLLEILRVIREEEPPKPSTKLSTADALPSLSANRSTEPKRLTGLLPNELDWVVMKALEKDRTRRYETASSFAADINRFLAGEPVGAHPPSRAYRLKKVLRKHKGPVTAAAAVVAALLVGIAGFAWQARVARRERDAAQAERNRATVAEAETRERADELKKVSDFQAQMLGQVDPTRAGRLLSDDVRAKHAAGLASAGVPEGERAKRIEAFAVQWNRVNATDAARDFIDRTILKPAVAAIDAQFADQPVVDAALRQALANRYREMGLYGAALPLQERALATRRRVLGEVHPDTLASVLGLGLLLTLQGRLNAAEPCLREGLEKCRRVLGEEHPDTIAGIHDTGLLLERQGKLRDAEPYYREALEKARHSLGEHHRQTLSLIDSLGNLLQSQGQLSAAELYYREDLEKSRRVFGDESPEVSIVLNNMGSLLAAQGKLSDAEPYLREALEVQRRLFGEEHPHTLIAINNLGLLLKQQGKLSAAEPYYREASEKFPRVMGAEHQNTLTAINNMGVLLQAQGKLSQAEPYLSEALEKRRRVLGEQHPDTLYSVNNLGSLFNAEGRHAEAAALLAPIEPATRKAFTGGNAYRLARLLVNLGKARTGLGQFAAAETGLLEAHGILVQTRGAKPQDLRDCTRAVFDLYTAWHAAEPGKAFDVKAAQWKARLERVKE